jgi:hypothetical protein
VDIDHAYAAYRLSGMTDVRGVGRSLLRQSVLVAVVSLALDCVSFLLTSQATLLPVIEINRKPTQK